VHDLPMTFTILSSRWVGDTGCPTKSSTKGGHPIYRMHTDFMTTLQDLIP
jgi:hypothetical protein